MKLKSEIKGGERYFLIEGFKEYALKEATILLSKGSTTYLPVPNHSPFLRNVIDKEIRERKLLIKEYFKKFPEALV
jgi:hypothetical protein